MEENRLNKNELFNHQRKLLSIEDYTSLTHNVSTRTQYTERKGQREVIILAQPEHPRVIHSATIKMYGNERVYEIKKHLREGDYNEDSIKKVNFKDLYESSWAGRSPYAQIELNTLKEVINIQKRKRKTHLNAKLA